jgi:hypothetical protein
MELVSITDRNLESDKVLLDGIFKWISFDEARATDLYDLTRAFNIENFLIDKPDNTYNP